MTLATLPWLVAAAGLLLAGAGALQGAFATRRLEARLVRLGSPGQRRVVEVPARWASLISRAALRLGLSRTPDLAAARQVLQRAGWRGPHAAEAYLLARIGLPMVCAAVVWGIASLRSMTGMALLEVIVAALAIGHFAPRIIVGNATKKRQAVLTRALPDGVDLLVVCVEAGMGINEAFARVGRELARAHPALAAEFTITAAELALLPDRSMALENLSARTGLDRLRGLVTTLLQAERFGTPIAQSLRGLAAEARTRRMLAAEERAAKLPVLLTVPMMIFILPVLFIVLLTPAVLSMIEAFS